MQSGQPNRLHTIDHYSLRSAQLHLKPMAWQRWALQIADNFGLLKTGLQNVAKIQDFRCFYCPNGCGRSATILVSFVTVSSPPSRQSSAALSPVTPQVRLSPRCLTSQASSHSHPANNFWYESCPCRACGCTPRSILRIFDTVVFSPGELNLHCQVPLENILALKAVPTSDASSFACSWAQKLCHTVQKPTDALK